MKTSVAVALALVASQAADAQAQDKKPPDQFFGPALNQLGAYLTGPVADSYRRASAAKFLEGAEQAGFSYPEAKSFSDGMIKGNIRFQSGGQWGYIVSSDPHAEIVAEPGTKTGYLSSFASVQTATTFLEKFSTIKLLVKPAPPRDYKVVVNGEQCTATEAGIYKVMPGLSAVKVTRPSKPECEWHGPLAPAEVKELDCSL